MPGLQDIAEKLSGTFDTRVTVSLGKRKGRIVVEFGSVEDLQRIVAPDGSAETADSARPGTPSRYVTVTAVMIDFRRPATSRMKATVHPTYFSCPRHASERQIATRPKLAPNTPPSPILEGLPWAVAPYGGPRA